MPSVSPTTAPTISPTRNPTTSPSAIPTVAPSQSPTKVPTCIPTASPSTRTPTVSPSVLPTVTPTVNPTVAPTTHPTVIPTTIPTCDPSCAPTVNPTVIPTINPSTTPTCAPTTMPTTEPTRSPTCIPTLTPTTDPSITPTVSPTLCPTVVPTAIPTILPTVMPTITPTASPTLIPTASPTVMPSASPTVDPTRTPTTAPTTNPSADPTCHPTAEPTIMPTMMPTMTPTVVPTLIPTAAPTVVPTANPTADPTVDPTTDPTVIPSAAPTLLPTAVPTVDPTTAPTVVPTFVPTVMPTVVPSSDPTTEPTLVPTTTPTTVPTAAPTMTPTQHPSASPTATPTVVPTISPTTIPTVDPTVDPTVLPTVTPTVSPTAVPTVSPTADPSTVPTVSPTLVPTTMPTAVPSADPTAAPSTDPSVHPTVAPTVTPTADPTLAPTTMPTAVPSADPTADPTLAPTTMPTAVPSADPTADPTLAPTTMPTVVPTVVPTIIPSTVPTVDPTTDPTCVPTVGPTTTPTTAPSTDPTTHPTVDPSATPTADPTLLPTTMPTLVPTADPTLIPTIMPTAAPTITPTTKPTTIPTMTPTSDPSMTPTANPSAVPTAVPSVSPTVLPSALPTVLPTVTPTVPPTMAPTTVPTVMPSVDPTVLPSVTPSVSPTVQPSTAPTLTPSTVPTASPSCDPTVSPTVCPSVDPSAVPSQNPTVTPSVIPSTAPTLSPSMVPSQDPTCDPTVIPSVHPSTHPTVAPTTAPTVSPSTLPTVNPTTTPTTSPTFTPTAPTASPTLRPAPGVSSLSASVSLITPRTVIEAQVLLVRGQNAVVYCGAFMESAPSVVEAILAQQFLSTSISNTATITITGLSPATEYRIYCATESFDGVLMSIGDVLSTSATVTTDCCKSVSGVFSATSVYSGAAAVNALTVSLDSLPSSDVAVQLTAVDFTTGAVSDLAFSPTSVQFLSSLSKKSAAFTVIGATAGKYTVRAVLSGASTAEYGSSNMVVLGTFTVLSSVAVPAVPQLQSAVFSSDGSSVLVTFDAPTNKGGYSNAFLCTRLLSFSGDSVATCQWSDASTITVYPSTAGVATLTLTSTITLLSNSDIKAQCTSQTSTVCAAWTSASAGSVMVTAPSELVVPNVILTMSSELRGCGPLTVDLSASSGSGGRSWTPPAFTVSSAAGDTTLIQALLNSNSSSARPTEVPNANFPADDSYTISVTLCNFLGACGEASRTVTVTKSSDIVPTVSIAGTQERTVKRKDALLLTSAAFTMNCNGTKSTLDLSYSWQVYSVGVLQSLLSSESLDVSKFRLSAYRLTTLSYYDIVLTATSTVSGKSSSATVSVFVAQSAVVAQVAGGSLQTVLVDNSLELDASSSYDMDVSGNTGTDAGLSFSWACVQISPVFSTTCPLVLTGPSDQKLGLSAASASIGTTSRLTVTVASGSRSSSASVQVAARDSSSPLVTMLTASQSVSSINTASRLALSASVTVQSPCTAVWSVNEPSVNITKTALTTVTTAVPIGSTRVVNLVLSANALPMRASLVFALSCGASTGQITVTTNGPPLPGKFSVVPPRGNELSDTFTFSASVWSDPDLPLTYQFGFASVSSGTVLVAQGKSEAGYASTTLPAGPASDDYTVTCIVRVFDSLNAESPATAVVTVDPLADQTQLQTAVLTQLSSAAGNNEATKNALSVGGAVINSVDCSRATNCASLYRSECGTVANTCGACLSGYIGDQGAANSICADATATSQSSVLGKVCTVDSDCAGFLECNTDLSSPVCYLPSKRCPDDCSGHGTCMKVNTNSRKTVLDCRAGDPTCSVMCQCNATYSGPNCGVAEAELNQKQAIRSEFLQSLSTVAATDDITSESLAVICNTLSSLTQNPYELTIDSIKLVNQIANQIIRNFGTLSTLSFSYEQAMGVLDAIDAAAEAAVRLDKATSLIATTEILETLSLFSSLISTQLVAGQDNVEYVQDTFRISSLRQMRSANSSLQIVSPSTLLERSTDTSSSSVTIESDATASRLLSTNADSEEEFSVNMVTNSASSYGTLGESFNTNPMQLTVSRTSATPTRATFTLVHNQAVQFSDPQAEDMVFNTTCANATDFSVQTYECPQSGEVLEHRCFGEAGVMTSYCPLLAPSCGILDAENGVVNVNSSVCEVVSYDQYQTVCSCTIEPSTARRSRRLDGTLDQIGLLDAVAVSVYIGTGFKNTFHSADDLTSAAALKRVLIVIVMFSSLWAGGLLLIFGCTWRRTLLKKVHEKTDMKLEKKMQTLQISRSPAVVHQYLSDYVTETFPSVFSNKPFFSRLYGEVKRHHRYLQVFTAPEGDIGDKQRILTGVELLTVQTMLMFLLAVLYDLQGPSDDGSCQAHTTETSCLFRKSVLDESVSYCDWVDTGASSMADYCVYRNPRFTLKIVLYIAVMVSILVSIIQYPVDRIFELLSAPLADDMKVATQDNALQKLGRRVSNMARRASNAAISVANAAKARINRASTIVGTATRKLPSSTESAHALATASMTVIAENSRRMIQQRQMNQLRSFYEVGGNKYAKDDGDSSSDSDVESQKSDSDSSRSSKSSASNKGAHVRGAENTRIQQRTVSQDPTRQLLSKLSEEVQCQRRLLQPSELDEFDSQWGLDPTGEFTQGERSVLPCFKGKAGAEDMIMSELRYVKDETAKKAEKLNIATDAHTGLEILHLFIKDLLGRDTPAAIIFETKSEEDFKHTKVVTRWAKGLAVAVLIGLNFFFVYFAMLTGYRRGVSWQRVYLMACIVQFAVEILLFETMECVWINCAIPVLVSDEVRRVGDSITEVVRSLCVNTQSDHSLFLSAPDYLFVSTNVAKKFPHLMESILVQAYTTHLPGELSRKWQVGAIARSHRHQRLRNATLLSSLMGTLQYLGTAPFVVHRLFIRFVQPFTLSGLVLLWQVVTSDIIYVSIAVPLIVIAIAYGLYRYYLSRADRVKHVTPVSAEYQKPDSAAVDVDGDRILEFTAEDDNPLNMPSPKVSMGKSRSSESRSNSTSSGYSHSAKEEQSELSSIISGSSLSHKQQTAAVCAAPKRTSVSSDTSLSSIALPPVHPSSMMSNTKTKSRVPYYYSSSSDGEDSSDHSLSTDDVHRPSTSQLSVREAAVLDAVTTDAAHAQVSADSDTSSVDIYMTISSESVSCHSQN